MMLYENPFAKRLFDFSFALLGLLVGFVPLLFIAGIIRLTSKGPSLFKQERIGRYGKKIIVYKFRTMYYTKKTTGNVTIKNDIRITAIGRILRKFKLDEFPQLINVVMGTMSLVGPRPDVTGYADRLRDEERVILLLRPGITGTASLFFRHEETILSEVNNFQYYNDTVIWPCKKKLNLIYAKSQYRLWFDIMLIMVTLFPVLRPVLKDLPKAPTNKIALEKFLIECQ